MKCKTVDGALDVVGHEVVEPRMWRAAGWAAVVLRTLKAGDDGTLVDRLTHSHTPRTPHPALMYEPIVIMYGSLRPEDVE